MIKSNILTHPFCGNEYSYNVEAHERVYSMSNWSKVCFSPCNILLMFHTLCVHYAHAADNLNSTKILKILDNSACALFLYNCTLNTLRTRERRRMVHSHMRRIDSFTFWVISFCWLYLNTRGIYILQKVLIFSLQLHKSIEFLPHFQRATLTISETL